ncbi:MAG: hypothetical protein GYB64_06060 [Chloroflexi bacterium]|nr:hypothetical protein [Chloroflexota bacterium]
MKKTIAVCVLLLSILLVAQPAAAQSEGTIAGIVYLDENGNGSRDEGEEGLLDIEVNFATSGWNTTINTDGAGAFTIDLNPATWTVSVLVPEEQYQATTDTSVEVLLEAPGDAVTDVAFGLTPVIAADGDGDGVEGGGEILPESGGPLPETTLIAGLVGLMAFGGVLVFVGQRRSRA